MEKKQIDWSSIGFGYIPTEKRYVSNYKDGKWDDGCLTEDANIVLNECAGVLQYSQSVFEGMKAYTTEDGRIVVFRPDMNAKRFADSARRLEMPVFPEDRFVDAIVQVVKANAAYVPPYGSGASLYIRPYMFGSNPVIGVKQSRVVSKNELGENVRSNRFSNIPRCLCLSARLFSERYCRLFRKGEYSYLPALR